MAGSEGVLCGDGMEGSRAATEAETQADLVSMQHPKRTLVTRTVALLDAHFRPGYCRPAAEHPCWRILVRHSVCFGRARRSPLGCHRDWWRVGLGGQLVPSAPLAVLYQSSLNQNLASCRPLSARFEDLFVSGEVEKCRGFKPGICVAPTARQSQWRA